MCKRDCQLFVTPMVSIPSAATRKFLCTASSTSRSMCSLSVPFGWEGNRIEHCCQNRSIFETEKYSTHKLMEKEDLEKSPLSFPRSSDQDEGFYNIHSYSVYRTDLCIWAAVNKNRRQAAQENSCFEEILHVASWLDQVVFDQYLRGMGSRGVQALIFPGLNFSRPFICNFFLSSLNSFLFRPQIKILFILFRVTYHCIPHNVFITTLIGPRLHTCRGQESHLLTANYL